MKLFRREAFWIITLGVVALFINSAPTINRFLSAPPGTVYNGTEFWTEDHSVYAGHFKEGAKGLWLVHDKHTSEPHKGFILRREYVIWGFLTGNILGLSPPLVYHSARIFGGILLVLSIYFLIVRIFQKKFLRIITFFSILFLAGIPKLDLVGSKKVDFFLPWLTELDPTIRFSVLWHYLVGGVCFIGVILFFWKYLACWKMKTGEKTGFIDTWVRPYAVIEKKNCSNFLGAVLLAGFGGMAHPSTLVTLYFTFGFYLTFLFILAILKRFDWGGWLARFYFIIGFVVFTLSVVTLLKIETTRFPWDIIAGWDKTTTVLPFWSFTLTIGPIVFLAVIGSLAVIIRSLVKKVDLATDRVWLIFCWGLSSYLLIFGLWSLTGINKIRFAQNPFYVPFSVLTIYGLYWMAGGVKKIVRGPRNWIVGLIVFICFVVGLPSYIHGVRREFNKFPTEEGLVFSNKKWLEGIYWLDENSKPSDVVLASYMASVLVPGYSGNTVYYGHSWSTIDFSKKADLMTQFFQGKMKVSEAESFLKEGNIDYIYYSWQEQSYGGNIKNRYEEFLKPVYEWSDSFILKVAR